MGSLEPAIEGTKLNREQTSCNPSGLAISFQLGIALSSPCRASSRGKAEAPCDKKENASLSAEVAENP